MGRSRIRQPEAGTAWSRGNVEYAAVGLAKTVLAARANPRDLAPSWSGQDKATLLVRGSTNAKETPALWLENLIEPRARATNSKLFSSCHIFGESRVVRGRGPLLQAWRGRSGPCPRKNDWRSPLQKKSAILNAKANKQWPEERGKEKRVDAGPRRTDMDCCTQFTDLSCLEARGREFKLSLRRSGSVDPS
jgi:hypothetical protein